MKYREFDLAALEEFNLHRPFLLTVKDIPKRFRQRDPGEVERITQLIYRRALAYYTSVRDHGGEKSQETPW